MSSPDGPYHKPHVSPYHNRPYPIPPLPEGFMVEHVDIAKDLGTMFDREPFDAEEPPKPGWVRGLMLALGSAADAAKSADEDPLKAAGVAALDYLQFCDPSDWNLVMETLIDWMEGRGYVRR